MKPFAFRIAQPPTEHSSRVSDKPYSFVLKRTALELAATARANDVSENETWDGININNVAMVLSIVYGIKHSTVVNELSSLTSDAYEFERRDITKK